MPMPTKEEQREYQRQWIAARRQEWIDEHGPCACGSWDDLEVDHIDPKTKSMPVSNVWSMARTNPKRVAELEKCQVLCGPCHSGKTKRSYGPTQHGTSAMYHKKCKCDSCKKYAKQAKAAWRAKTGNH